MFRTSYLREVRKEKYERSDVFEDTEDPERSAGISAIQGWESLQELNSRFARYINRARVLEQRNAVFRKQLETLQRMEEASGLEEAFTEQIDVNRQRIRELCSDRSKLERELREACRMLDEFTSKYKNECDYQEQLRGTLENLNKEADNALLRNLEYQIQSQFLQDDINSTRDRHKKNLAEIQTYVNILQQINQTLPLAPNVSVGISEEQEKLLAQRKIPGLKSQLEEYKSALCQLQVQKQCLQSDTAMLEQGMKNTQESYEDEIQMFNEKIDSLRKDIDGAERSLEKFTSECRHLAMYQTSLENELERYKRIIENEDNRLNSAIIGTPITLLTTNYRYTHTPTASSRGRDITQAIQDITSIKPRQKILAKKVLKKKELTPKDVMESIQDERSGGADGVVEDEEMRGTSSVEVQEERVKRKQQRPLHTGVSPQDVPDGAQISKAFDTLCNIVRDRMRKYKRPEPIADFYTKGRYVLVSGDGSYLDPCFYTSTPSAGHIFVTIRDGMISPYEPYGHRTPSPPPPQPMIDPRPLSPDRPSDTGGKDNNKGGKAKDSEGKAKHNNGDPHPYSKHPSPVPPPSGKSSQDPAPAHNKSKKNKEDNGPSGPAPKPAPRGPATSSSSFTPDAMSYEKVEVVESVEKFSKDRKVKGYEETSVVVETMIEKSSKKKP
ncbi:filensin [Odontesthes bonariensis]|uniref:filensin n=1 Tax=Odontesthes bonariensis TaxID=219752 RepID=UPI003F58979C